MDSPGTAEPSGRRDTHWRYATAVEAARTLAQGPPRPEVPLEEGGSSAPSA